MRLHAIMWQQMQSLPNSLKRVKHATVNNFPVGFLFVHNQKRFSHANMQTNFVLLPAFERQ